MLGEKRLKTAVNHGDFKVPSQRIFPTHIDHRRPNRLGIEGCIPVQDGGSHGSAQRKSHFTKRIKERIAEFRRTHNHPEITPGVNLLLLDGGLIHFKGS
jgi:hypothetical protein